MFQRVSRNLLMSRHGISAFALFSIILMLTSTVLAEAPKLISYQGRAADSSGNPVADDIHVVQFQIYDKFNNLEWEEFASVTTSAGLFTHNLGSVTPLNPTIFNWQDSLFLQITFDGQVQLPRTIFTASPYAYHVNSIDGSEGGVVNEYISIHSSAADDEVAGIAVSPGGDANIWMKDVDGHKKAKLDVATLSLAFVDPTMGNDTTFYGMHSLRMAGTENQIRLDANQGSLVIKDLGSDNDSASISPIFFSNNYVYMEKDISGEGAGYLMVKGSGGDPAFIVDGNYLNADFPVVDIVGPTQAIVFSAGSTGNASVLLPNNAIKSPEIANEAGVGSYINQTGYEITAPAGQLTYLGSRAMFAPSTGYVLVIASAEVQIHHAASVVDRMVFGITDNCTSLYASSKISLQLPGAVPAGFYYLPVTVHGLFPVDSGTTTFCFMVDNESGSYSKTVENITISELFVPTAYTTVIQPAAPNQPLDPEAERASELSFHETRLQAELEQMKAEVEAIKKELRDVVENTSQQK